MADEAETERVTFTIANPRTVNSKSLYALVDVEVQVAGLSFKIIGVQVRHGSTGLSVCLPTLPMSTAPGNPWSRCPRSCSGR
jgi:hypothetical protein